MSQAPDTLTAALVDRYRLERELGSGGMATVWLAEDVKHHRQVAVKVLREDLTASLGKERFLREITIAAGLTHPHILPLHDSGEAAGRLFYVMPYVDGPSLRQKLLKVGELPIAEAARILRDVADAMAHAHKRGVVHRDLKPENVMLTERHALVTDFGVAKAVSEATGRQTLTTAGVALGTPAYMSPEQATADPHADHRSDIYAFGVLAYELLTGRTPFQGGSPQEVLAAHVTTAAQPVTSYRASIPPALAALVMRCLEKKPADRPQSAEELIPQLEALLTPSGGITPHETAPFPARRATWMTRMAIAAGLTIVAALGYSAWRTRASGSGGAGTTDRIAVTWFENRTGDSAQADVGMLAAEYIIEGLAREGVTGLVPSAYIRELMAGELRSSPAPVRALAEKTSAAVVVTGSYTGRGDTLELRAELLDSAGRHLLARVGPVRVLRMETAGLDSLFQQVAVALDSRRAWGASGMIWPRPRNLAAWREFQTGVMEHFIRGDWAGAIPFYQRALQHDSTWDAPYAQISASLSNMGRREAADSVLDVAARIIASPPPSVQAVWDWHRASHRGDYEAMYRAGRKIHDLDPSDTYDAALPAARTGRYREALQLSAQRDTSPWNTEWRPWERVILVSHHLLGQYEAELSHARQNVARRGLDLGTAIWVVRPLAALGRSVTVDSLFALVKDMPPLGGTTPADIASSASWELLAHGHDPGIVRRTSQLALDYYDALPMAERGPFAADRALSAMMTGRLPEARAAFDSLSAASPTNIALLGQLGAVAALQGDTTAARVIDTRLAAMSGPYIRGANTLWRATITGLLGDCARAASSLRQAFADGVLRNNYAHHHWAALGKARQCRELQDALKPRD